VTKSGPEAERFTMKDGLLTDIPTALLEDHEGNVWVGSANGLERFREGAFTPVLTTGPARPRFVVAGRDSSVWTAPYNLGTLQRFGPNGREDFYTGFFTRTVAQDASGRAIVVGDTRMLRLEGKRFVPVKLRPGTARGLYNVATDPAGTIWVHSEVHGLLRLDGDSLVPVANTVASMYHDGQPFSDSKGTIWVAQYNTVHRYAGHTLTTYSKDQGIWGFVYGFFEDTSGTIWAATGDGLSRFEGDSFHTLKRKGQIPGYTVVGMAQDDGGAWWLATLPGILRFPPGEIERALADSNHVPSYRAFDESDGMVGALVKGYWGPVLAKSGDGKIWVATDSGLATIDPRRVPVATPPPVSLEVVRIEGRELAIVDGAELPPETRDLEIDYTSLTFGTPERVRFRYQLEGADPAWREVGDRRRAYYTGLAPGSYRFRVSASYGDGLWNEAGAAWSFRVLPAWHATLWFKGLVILASSGLVAFAVAMVQRGRHARAQQLLRHEYEATMAERARIADDLHDTLLQGFTGVNLQLAAAELTLPGSPEVAAATLVRIQRLAEESLREARERVWEMRETAAASDDLSTALEAVARDRTAGLPITVVVSASGAAGRLPRAVGDAAFRIGREAIMNVVRHAEASRIEIHLDFREQTFALEVRDDGRGLGSGEASKRGHFGIEGMKNRARHQGGRCEVRPRPGGGTIVAVEMPLVQVRI
jgi:signal transduction histidine kinase